MGPQGGTLSNLVFAVVGDTRPQNVDDNAGYPTQQITQIFQDIQNSNPRPAFVVASGDYMFATSSQATSPGGNALIQIQNYIQAMKGFSGQVFPTMGNHECTGYTASNCGTSGSDGITDNYLTFIQTLLGACGINSTNQPTLANQEAYYSFKVSSSAGVSPAWTAKFVMVAANAWDSNQASWLSQVMAETTTYTFVIRHESYQDDGGASSNLPGDQGASDATIANFPYTALLVGHTHEYKQSVSGTNQIEMIVGNGGAQTATSGSQGPGYAIVTQLSNGNVTISQYEAGSPNAAVATATVNATGAVQ